jgi:hypothetical protein
MFPDNGMKSPFKQGPQSPYDWRSPDGDDPKEGGSSVPRKPKPNKPSGSSGKKVGV